MRDLFLLMMASCSMLLSAESFTVGKLNYETTSENTVAITYSDDGYYDLANADFSATVTNNGKTYTVTEIGEYAFEEAVFAESINFPSTIETIGYNAFYFAEADGLSFNFSDKLAQLGGECFVASSVDAINIAEGNKVFASVDGVLYSADKKTLLAFPPGKNVESFTIPAFVERIYEGAFLGGQWYLQEVTIPATVKSVDSYAFQDDADIIKLTIESPDTELGSGAFMGCEGLTELNLPEGLKTIPDNCFFDLASLPTLKLPEGLESIGKSGFGFGGFTEIVFPSTLKTIGMQAFANCEALVSVSLPDAVVELGSNSFASCTALESFDLNNAKNLGEFSFSSCSSLTSVKSKCLEVIGDAAFYMCTSLKEYIVPETVKTIGGTAFFGTTALEKLVVGKNVETIGLGMTVKTPSLPAIEVDADNQNFVATDGVLYTKDMTKLLAYPGGRTATAFKVPSTVTTIGDQALRASNVVSFECGDNVTTIASNALAMCADLTTVVLGANVNTMATSVFNQSKAITSVTCLNPTPAADVTFTNEVYAAATLWLPSNEAVTAYKATDNWGKFENIMVITNGLDELGSAIEVVNETYYDIDGKQLTAPLQGKTIIAVRKYSNGTTRVTKEIAK